MPVRKRDWSSLQVKSGCQCNQTGNLPMTTRLIATLLILLTQVSISSASYEQNATRRAEAAIMAFLKAVYVSTVPSDSIAKQYIGLANTSSELTLEKRYEMAAKHIH